MLNLLKIILKSLPRDLKQKFLQLQVLAIVCALAEAFLLWQVNEIIQSDSSSWYFRYFDNYQYFVFLICISLLILIGNLRLILKVSVIALQLGAAISDRIFERYLSESYSEHIQQSSTDKLNLLTVDVVRATNAFLVPISHLIPRAIIALVITVVALNENPYTFTAILIYFTLVLAIIFYASKVFLKKNSVIVQLATEKRMATSNFAFNQFRQVKLRHQENAVLDIFRTSGINFAEALGRNQAITALPRFVLESSIIFSVLFYALLSNIGEATFTAPSPIIVVALLRIIPVLQAIYQVYSSQNSHYASLEKAVSVLSKQKLQKLDVAQKNRNKLSTIVCRDVCFSHDNKVVFENVTFDFELGQLNFIIGPSGSGKSTIIDLVLGLVTPNRGFIGVNGDLTPANYQSTNYFYVSADDYVPPGTLEDYFSFAGIKLDENLELLRDYLIKFELSGVVTEPYLKFQMYEGASNLSRGQRQRLNLIRGLLSDPEILILDEATSGLDKDMENEVVKILRDISKSRLVILVTHNLQLISDDDIVLKLERENDKLYYN